METPDPRSIYPYTDDSCYRDSLYWPCAGPSRDLRAPTWVGTQIYVNNTKKKEPTHNPQFQQAPTIQPLRKPTLVPTSETHRLWKCWGATGSQVVAARIPFVECQASSTNTYTFGSARLLNEQYPQSHFALRVRGPGRGSDRPQAPPAGPAEAKAKAHRPGPC